MGDEFYYIADAIRRGQLSGDGHYTKLCEAWLRNKTGALAAKTTNSCTAALEMAAILCNLGPGDEVIMPSFTFVSTANAVVLRGATPVFVDIDPVTFNMDVSQVEAKITENTKAIMPVHLYGQVADMPAIQAIADKHNLVVIEDGAQAFGAEHKGVRAGATGDYGTFSFFPSKNLGGAGDGGMVVTQSEEKAEQLKVFRNHGSQPKYYHKFVGGNFRLDSLQAAVVRVK